MKLCTVVFASLALAVARADVSHVVGVQQPRSPDADAQIISQERSGDPLGNFRYGFKTSNGIAAEEEGDVQDIGEEKPALHVKGSAQWISKEGEDIGFSYEAGVGGYVAYGPAIPTPWPIPPYILEAQEFIRQQSEKTNQQNANSQRRER